MTLEQALDLRQEVDRTLQQGDHAAWIAEIERVIVVEELRGEWAALSIAGDKAVEVVREQDGTLTFGGAVEARRARHLLPSPERAHSPVPERTLGIHSMVPAAAMQILAQRVAELLEQERGPEWTEGHSRHQVGVCIPQGVQRLRAPVANALRGNGPYRAMEQAVRRMIDQEAWAVCQKRDGRTLASRYNRALQGASVMRAVREHNPGVAAWWLADHRARKERISHPGEIIARVRQRAESAGVERGAWRTLARMDEAVINFLMADRMPRHIAALIINAAARYATHPSREQVEQAATLIKRVRQRTTRLYAPRSDDSEEKRRARETMTRTTGAMLRHQWGALPPQRMRDDTAITDVADYLADRLSNGADITATTYGGLVKASDHWHREMRNADADREVANQLRGQEGWRRAWTSHASEIVAADNEGNDITFTAITDEAELVREGSLMAHCVGRYTADCWSGRVRIFTATGGRLRATASIARSGGRWRPEQFRTRHNGVVDESAMAALRRAADSYQRTERERQPRRGMAQGWFEPGQSPQTGECAGMPHDATLTIPTLGLAGIDGFEPWKNVRQVIEEQTHWGSREAAELNLAAHQLVGMCVLTDGNNRALAMKRSASQRTWMSERTSILVGGHPEPGDHRGQSTAAALRATALRELAEETNAKPVKLPTRPVGIVIDRGSPERAQHVAVVFSIQIKDGDVQASAPEEFGAETELMDLNELEKIRERLDPWSAILLEHMRRQPSR